MLPIISLKHLWSLLFILLCCLFTAAVTAEATDIHNIEFMTVNPELVIEQSKAFISVQKQIEEKNLEYKQSAFNNQNELQKLYNELQQHKDQIDEREFEARSKEIADRAKLYYDIAYVQKRIIDEALERAKQSIEGELDQIIENIVKQRKHAVVILNHNQVVHSPEFLDQTQNILSELDKRLPYLQIEFRAE